jgi:hypothetical protein
LSNEVNMKTRATRADEMTPRPVFGRPASQTVHNLTGVASASTVVTARDRGALPGFVAAVPLRRPPKAVVIGVFLVALLFERPVFAQYVRNPSFEQKQIGPPYLSFTAPPFWTHTGPNGDALIWNILYPGTGVAAPGGGNQFVTLGGGILGPVKQYSEWVTTISGLSPGQTYRLGFWIANEGFSVSQTITATVDPAVGPPTGVTGTFTTTCGSGQYYWQCWEQEYLLFTAVPGNTKANLIFSVYDQQYDIGLDEITIKEAPPTGGTWTKICEPGPTPGTCVPLPCSGAGAALLLTDGRVLVYDDTNLNKPTRGDWCTLTPDQFGDYATGTWAEVASFFTLPPGSCYAPHAFASAVLPDADGRVIVEGGEFNNSSVSGCSSQTDTNSGAIYDPVKDAWSPVTPPPGWTTIGDAQSVVLPNGTFMLANSQNSQEAEMTGPSSWVPTGTLKDTRNDEEGWTLLPGPPDAEMVLTVDTSSGTCPGPSSEVYSSGTWFCIGSTPTQLWDSTTHEIGPAVLRPDGTVFQAGGTVVTISNHGESAIFDLNTYKWTAGPNFPNNSHADPLTIADGPAALLPDGNVLMMASSPSKLGATFLELQYLTNSLVVVPAPPNAPNDVSMNGHMLELPTGQIWFSDFSKDVEIYTPTTSAVDNSWRPVVQDINSNAVATSCLGIFSVPPHPCLTVHQTTNTLDGLQLNGLSQGAAYGDDYQSATNYPLVSITEAVPPFCFNGVPCPTPRVYYCRTHDHSNMGVATGSLLVSTMFDCPNVPVGFVGYLNVVANGIQGGGIPVVIVP